YMETEIPFSLAVMGGEIDVPTMRGLSKMKVHRGTKGGTVLRMKGKGVQTEEGRLGDQLVRVSIHIPKKLSKEQKEYLKRFDDVFD
ncbi:MAG: DnaJ C-terminal domain-containing protein, partial [Candidatus Thorarchaeota archaeon]